MEKPKSVTNLNQSFTSYRSETSIFSKKTVGNELEENEIPISGTVLPDGTVVVRTFLSEEKLVELPHHQHLISKKYLALFYTLFIIMFVSVVMIIVTILMDKPWLDNKGL